jgi:hypothetical protein
VRGPVAESDVHRARDTCLDSNPLDPAQVVETMDIPTTDERPVYLALARTDEDRTAATRRCGRTWADAK